MASTSDTGRIEDWRSIVTLVLFVITNIIVIFPFHIPVYIPRVLDNATLDLLAYLRVISARDDRRRKAVDSAPAFVRREFPMNFITAPLIADLFLIAILAIGRQEVYDGTIGANNISPIDIMAFFITLAYIAISIDASGLIRYLAFRVLKFGGRTGYRLFFCLYCFLFSLAAFIGNDPVILSGTAFLAYMTRVSKNIKHPRAWIFTQFAAANIASAILVSSNPTNLVLAGAFQIKFIVYTAHMIVPVVVTAVVLYPFLLYVIFADPASRGRPNQELIPAKIDMRTLSSGQQDQDPVNPNIPNAHGVETEENVSLQEVLNPFLDKGGAAFGAVIMAITLITILALNAATQETGEHPVFWVTVPAAFVMLCWDLGFGWCHRADTRKFARDRKETVDYAQAKEMIREERDRRRADLREGGAVLVPEVDEKRNEHGPASSRRPGNDPAGNQQSRPMEAPSVHVLADESERVSRLDVNKRNPSYDVDADPDPELIIFQKMSEIRNEGPLTLVRLIKRAWWWTQITFPTTAAVFTHLPFALVPFAFGMFVLVQGLVTKGWVSVFAHGWDHWVDKTGTVGAIGGMAFVSVVLCNFAGTNIGATILLSRVIQEWQQIHASNQIPISDRTFWGTVYAMALGVNYGAFSTVFSASLAGLLWRDILARKHIPVGRLEFARYNLGIITIAMTVGCAVLVGEIYIVKTDAPYSMK